MSDIHCPKCNDDLPEDSFGIDNKRPNGRQLWCRQCKAEYRKSDKFKATKQKWLDNNKDRMTEYKQLYYDLHSDSIKSRAANYRATNPELVKEYKNKWYKTDQGRLSILLKTKRRQSTLNSLPSDLTQAQWLSTLEEFDNSCGYCGNTEKLHQEHVIPISKDGPYTKWNIIPGCQSCNSSKSDKDMLDWYMEQEFFNPIRLEKILSFMEVNNIG